MLFWICITYNLNAASSLTSSAHVAALPPKVELKLVLRVSWTKERALGPKNAIATNLCGIRFIYSQSRGLPTPLFHDQLLPMRGRIQREIMMRRQTGQRLSLGVLRYDLVQGDTLYSANLPRNTESTHDAKCDRMVFRESEEAEYQTCGN